MKKLMKIVIFQDFQKLWEEYSQIQKNMNLLIQVPY